VAEPAHDASRTEPAIGGLRFMLVLMLACLAGCASQPKPVTETPKPLVDRSADTDYQVGEIEKKLQAASQYDREGNRQVAVAVIDTARQMLPPESERERQYLDTVKAGVWARPGEDRDGKKAADLLGPVAKFATDHKDRRLLADVLVARVLLNLGDKDRQQALKNADAALRELSGVEAYAEEALTARRLSFEFMDAEDSASAELFARRAFDTSRRLQDDRLILQTGSDLARLLLTTGGDAEYYFNLAYEAGFRMSGGGWGWRNIVITAAVDAYFTHDDMKNCVKWGDRLRDLDEGKLPSLEKSELWAEDYISALAQYAFASRKLGKAGPRAQEAAELAIAEINNMDEADRGAWDELAEKLRSGLLQEPREK